MSDKPASTAIFLGSKQFGLQILRCLLQLNSATRWLIVHPDDAADPRSNMDEFRAFTREQGLDMRVVASPAEAKEAILASGADIGLVCGWYWLFDKQARDHLPLGLWGIHNSLLPKYRGQAPLVWSIINGEPFVGSTFFRIADGIDSGDILCQVKVPLKPEHTVQDALYEIENALEAELASKWEALLARKAVLITQDESQATYAGARIPADGLIDWGMDAGAVHNFIRAQSAPYPGAFTYLGAAKLTIVRARPNPTRYHGIPGQVLRCGADFVLVACGGSTCIEILSVMRQEDAEPRPAAELLRSVRDRLRNSPAAPSL